jgi:hypothetical protein
LARIPNLKKRAESKQKCNFKKIDEISRESNGDGKFRLTDIDNE